MPLDENGHCVCDQCLRHKDQREAIEGRNTDRLIYWVEWLENAFMCEQLDNDMPRPIIQGTDPESVERLTFWLERAKDIE